MRALISTPFFRGGRTVLKKEEVRDYEGLNVALATWYLQTLIDQFESDKNTLYTGRNAVRAALAAYNRGRREVLKYGLGKPQTKSGTFYADSVLACERILKK